MKAQIQTSLFQVSEIKVSYQPNFKASERPKISSSKNAYDILIAGCLKSRSAISCMLFTSLIFCAV
jgi:hypothetical protein